MTLNDKLIDMIDYFDYITLETSAGKSLKQIKIKDIDSIDFIGKDINDILNKFEPPLDSEIEWRIKSIESANLKFKKYQRLDLETANFYRLNSCLNDIIGFRLKSFEDKNKILNELNNQTDFRVVNLLEGKEIDDGYRAIHLYRELGGKYYPVEVQIWFKEDFNYNFWMHKYAYKTLSSRQLKELFENYKNGDINSENDFLKHINFIKNKEIEPSLFEWS